ncbi:MAG TPA: PAS-domain containing protein, partial [Actinomycetota bacterium]|nr:PAS-domain containing protein [Actinomycetota bacterium]
MHSLAVIAVSGAYLGLLFGIAWWADRKAADGSFARTFGPWAAITFALTLAIYNTSWSFYGSVGRAAASGLDFLPIYIGPTLVLLFGHRMLAKVIAIAKAQNVTSISDFIAARYGKSQLIAALVTVTALIGVLPYIALQLKAVGTSFDVLTSPGPAGTDEIVPFWRDSAFAVALAMAAFTIVFGVRHINASEHHRGLMVAIAFESLVKLGAFLAVAAFIVFGMSDGIGALLDRAAESPGLRPLLTVDLGQPAWFATTLIAVIAFLCLPHAFHVAVVENDDPRHARFAAWFYPVYLAALSVFMVPIAIVGLTTLDASINPDTFVISLPIAADRPGFALLAFIGGLSAATGMVIVAAVSLSTMLCNDVIIPLLLRSGLVQRTGGRDLSRLLLRIRRGAVVAVLLLAYLMYRALDRGFPLTQIGLVSFVAIAQLGPAFFLGLYWRRASAAGAAAGIAVGFLIWAYTLLVPAMLPLTPLSAELLAQGPLGIAALRPRGLFGTGALDLISHATLWSLAGNLLVFVAVSWATRQSPVERLQAAAFVSGAAAEDGSPRPRAGLARLEDLRALAARFVGAERSETAFGNYLRGRDGADAPERSGLADLDAVRFTEHLVAGAIGAPSARVVMAASLETVSLSRGAAMAMLDEASEALRFNRSLLQSTLESVPQGICTFDDELRITAWNGRFVRLLGLPEPFVRVGLPLSELIAFNRDRGEYRSEDLNALLTSRDLPNQT